MKNGDLIYQKEESISRRFAAFGPDALQALLRVFRRYGHFRPLLEHMKLLAAGDLEEQEDTLFRILSRYGERVFMQAIEQGTNPTQIVSKIWETPLEVVAEGVLVPAGADSVMSEQPQRTASSRGASAFGSSPSACHQAPTQSGADGLPLPDLMPFQAMGAPIPTPAASTGDNVPGSHGFIERRTVSDRRKKTPGRRATLTFGMSDERRRGACRRKSKRRATD